MLDIDLMILFNGFIKNYINLGLTKDSNNIEILKQENKYFSTIGKLLGFSVINKIDSNGMNNEVCWKDEEFSIIDRSSIKLELFRESDLTKDLLAVHTLVNRIKENSDSSYIQIMEIPSYNRIDFLNNILKKSIKLCTTEYLIIYVWRNVIENITYFNAYLFKGNEIIKNKIGVSYINKEGRLKASFRIY